MLLTTITILLTSNVGFPTNLLTKISYYLTLFCAFLLTFEFFFKNNEYIHFPDNFQIFPNESVTRHKIR